MCNERWGIGLREVLEANAMVEAKEQEGSVEIPQEIKSPIIICSSSFTPGYIPKIMVKSLKGTFRFKATE